MASEGTDGRPTGSGRLALSAGGIWAGRVTGDGHLTITCLSGILWVTREGDASDYILRPGEDFRTAAPGLVVAEAMEPSRFRIETKRRPESGWLSMLRDFAAGIGIAHRHGATSRIR